MKKFLIASILTFSAIFARADYAPIKGSTISASQSVMTPVMTATVNVVTPAINGTFIGWGRNRALNGDFRFDQRYEGSKSTSTSSTKFYLDHWGTFADTSTFTAQRDSQNPPRGFTNYLRITLTKSSVSGSTSTQMGGATNGFFTRIEGPYIKDWGWGAAGAKTISVSFVAMSSVTGTYAFSIKNTDNSRSLISTFSITAANTWTTIAVPIVGDTSGTWLTGSGTRGAEIDFDAGTGANFENSANNWLGANRFRVAGNVMISTSSVGTSFSITGFQVEIGTGPTSFEFLPDDLELKGLQRYCEKSYAIGTATGTSTTTSLAELTGAQVGASTPQTGTFKFFTQKLGSPTLTLWNESGTGGQWNWTSTAGVATARTTTGAPTPLGFSLFQTTALEFYTRGHYLAESEVP